jgi:hypothetical protein
MNREGRPAKWFTNVAIAGAKSPADCNITGRHRAASLPVTLGEMAISRKKFEKRAIKAGIRASKCRHHLVTKEELLSLKIQVMPDTLRGILILAGLAAILGAAIGWPFSADHHQILMGIGGGVSLIFGVFGMTRTLEKVGDAFANQGFDALLEGIFSAIGNVVDF